MEIKQIKCDVCEREKREGECWFIAKQSRAGILFQRERDVEWPRDPNYVYENICDGHCPEARLQRWLDEQRIYVLLPATRMFRLKAAGAAGTETQMEKDNVHTGSDRRLASGARSNR